MEEFIKIPVVKVIELILAEERSKIKAHYTTVLGQAGGDVLNTYNPQESELMKILKM